MECRLIGPDGETWVTAWHVPDPPPLELRIPLNPRLKLSDYANPLNPLDLEIRQAVFVRETFLGCEDGGPLMIYRCKDAY